MKVFFGLRDIKKFKRPFVAIGVFDGIHRAHIKILKEAVLSAKKSGGTSVVLTFWPHPQKERSIYSLKHRIKIMSGLGIQRCVVLKFDRALANVPAEVFIKKVLVDKLKAHTVLVGANFRFGKHARGDAGLLERSSRLYGFGVKVFKSIRLRGEEVSSTYIRRLISKGQLLKAKKLLSRPVSVLGDVVKGNALGRRLGFPTANIDPHHEVLPPQGVYAVEVSLNDRKSAGVCYIGTRPTFRRQKIKDDSKTVEVHILNLKKSLYGKELEVFFVKKLREEKRFSDQKALCLQIQKDIERAKRSFRRNYPHHNI